MRNNRIVLSVIGCAVVLLLCAGTGVTQDTPGPQQGPQPGAPAQPDFCMFLANHWSYTGIGWSSGLKSCAQSVTDSLAMADYRPSVKTGINLDAAAYPMLAASYPEVVERLKRYLAEGKVEIIGGTYGQPMGSMVSGESNVRQLVAGQQTIQSVLGVRVSAFLEEEEFTHPQVPQLLTGAGYRGASSAQCNTWGKHGSPPLDRNIVLWRGIDGTRIPTTPINGLVFHPPCVTHDIEWLWSPSGRNRVQELGRLGMPLAIKWVEFGWGPDELEGKTANKFLASKYGQLAEQFSVQHVTLTEYLDQYAGQAKEEVQWHMDDFRKLQPWGCGGDQLRREGREVEAVLTAAERFDAAASLLGLAQGREAELDAAWKHLLVAQSHDVSLCEYADDGINDPAAQQFLAATGTAAENSEVKTWGAMGFRHMAEARKTGRRILEAALAAIAASVDTANESRGSKAIIVFNPCGAPRDALVTARGISLETLAGSHVVVRNAQGQAVLSQELSSGPVDAPATSGVMFFARQLPSFGYATYYLDSVGSDASEVESDLRTSGSGWKLENACVSVELDAATGAITRLFDRRSSTEMISGRRPFPTFIGRPHSSHPAGEDVPQEYDSSRSQAEISWVERGPLRAVVKAVHTWPKMRVEHSITLHAGQPQVEVVVRVSADVPPATTTERENGWQPPLHITDGYWFSFETAFKPTAVIRDFPFGIEPCGKDAIDALSFVDLAGSQGGLLVVHSGTQYFKRSDDGVFSNLAIRDFHGLFVKPGWPRTAEYRFVLTPHGNGFTNLDRLRCVEEFDYEPLCTLAELHAGRLSKQRSFVSLDSPSIVLSAFRGLVGGGYEARLIEQAGVPAVGTLRIDLPAKQYASCDLLGNVRESSQSLSDGTVRLSLRPWQLQSLRIENERVKP